MVTFISNAERCPLTAEEARELSRRAKANFISIIPDIADRLIRSILVAVKSVAMSQRGPTSHKVKKWDHPSEVHEAVVRKLNELGFEAYEQDCWELVDDVSRTIPCLIVSWGKE